MPIGHRGSPVSPLHLTACFLFFTSLIQSCASGRERSPCLCPCQVLAGGGGGQEAMSREGGTWPFPFPSSQISSLSGRSLFLAPLPAFPDAATAPLSQTESQSQRSAKWNRLYSQEGGNGCPHQAQLLPCPSGHTCVRARTPCHPQDRRESSQSAVHRRPNWARLQAQMRER